MKYRKYLLLRIRFINVSVGSVEIRILIPTIL